MEYHTAKQIEDIAKVCHEANRAYCETQNDPSQVEWNKAEKWQKDSAILGVKFNLDNPAAPASSSHDCWLAEKKKEGWKYGKIKDAVKKTHPCYVPYGDLPVFQQKKDLLFKRVVNALR